MGKALGSWSAMRQYLEQDMLAECLKGRVRYNCTHYVGMDDSRIFEIYIDGELTKRCSWETVNTFFIKHGYKENSQPFGKMEYWFGFWPLLEKVPIRERPEHTDEEFCTALTNYRNQQIHVSLFSANPLERMFAVLDRRIGKRTLKSVIEKLSEQPPWLLRFYELRLKAEGLV